MRDVLSRVALHEEWRLKRCINLQPSENVTSESVRRLLSSDFGHRYTLPINEEVHGSYVENAYRGTRYLDEVEGLGESLACELFGGEFASLKPLSGHVAGMLMLLATCRRGDRILVIDTRHGGYDGYFREGMPQIFGLEVDVMPFVSERWNIDHEKTAAKIIEWKPRLIVLGASFILFPYEMRRIREAADEVGASIGYDGSHVLGLVAGGRFQRPLPEGADILVGSTHKSFFGPQGGLLVCKDRGLFDRVKKCFYWQVMDNAHWNRIAALTQSLLEMKRFGVEYADNVVRNSKRLASEMAKRGLPARFEDHGYTECHQIHLDEGALKDRWGLTFNEFANRLERNNIIVDAVGRVGTNEVSRLGATEDLMPTIADLMERALRGDDVTEEVLSICSQFRMHYCFEFASTKQTDDIGSRVQKSQ